MSKVYLVDGSTMDALADVIQEKAGTTSKLTPAQMIEAAKGIQVGVTLPDAEDAYFGGVEVEEEYSVRGDSLTGIAEQVQRLFDTEEAMTPEQMKLNLMNVVSASELPSAEEAIFGVNNPTIETGIVTLGTLNSETVDYIYYPFNKFTAREAISIIGLRVYVTRNTKKRTLCLWNASGDKVRETEEITPSFNAWTVAYFDEPFNVAAGESFAVSSSGVSYPTYSDASTTTINAKVSFDGGAQTFSDSFPSTFYTSYYRGVVDFIAAPVSAKLPSNYQITRTALDDIANEAQRITGATTKLTTAQIQSALESVILQEKFIAPTTAQQEVVPDAGYYGLSKVTVEAAPTLPRAELVSFSAAKNKPDERYSIGQNWFASVVERLRVMVNSNRDFTPEEIVYWLGRVAYIPQGHASSEFTLDFATGASGILPTVYNGTANSEFSLNFESSAVGALSE